MMLDGLHLGNKVGSVGPAAASNIHCDMLSVCSEYRVSFICIGKEPVQLCKTNG